MPNRILREGILSSERIAKLKWDEEVFYRRVMSIVDDYGRTEVNEQLLRARCYPLQIDQVRVADISRWMAACRMAGLISFYVVNDKRYLEILDFHQQQRTASKYPSPADASKCYQMLADEHLDVCVDVCVVEGDIAESKSSLSAVSVSKAGRKVLQQLPDDWKPKQSTIDKLSREFGLASEDVERYVAAFTDACRAKQYRYADFDAAFRNCVRQDWPKLRGHPASKPDPFGNAL